MAKPLISVVTPSFNQGQFLEQTILSVLQQDYPHFEYIIVDGGSTDESVSIIEKYEHKLSYWVSERDQGQAEALYKGFRRAHGDIFCWINSDDLFLPGAFSAVAKYFLENPEVEVVNGGAYCIDANGVPMTKQLPFFVFSLGFEATHDYFRFSKAQSLVFQQSTFWRRTAYDGVGGIDTTLRFCMDLDLFLRLSKRRKFAKLPVFLACFRWHDQCKTSTLEDLRQREVELLARRYGQTEYSRLAQSILYWRYRVPVLTTKIYLYLIRRLGFIELKAVQGLL